MLSRRHLELAIVHVHVLDDRAFVQAQTCSFWDRKRRKQAVERQLAVRLWIANLRLRHVEAAARRPHGPQGVAGVTKDRRDEGDRRRGEGDRRRGEGDRFGEGDRHAARATDAARATGAARATSKCASGGAGRSTDRRVVVVEHDSPFPRAIPGPPCRGRSFAGSSTAGPSDRGQHPKKRRNPLFLCFFCIQAARKKKKVNPFTNKRKPLRILESMPDDHHALRRKEIMRVHGRAVQKLCGPEWRSKYVALLLIAASLYASLVLAPSLERWSTWLMLAYVGGATLSNALFLAIHELSHGLMFASRRANAAFAMIVNLPIFIPYSVAFREFNLDHHKHLHSERDMDVPTAFEARVVGANPVLRVAWVALQLVVYAIRPVCVRSRGARTRRQRLQLAFDVAVAFRFGCAPFVFQLASMVMAEASPHRWPLFRGADALRWSTPRPEDLLVLRLAQLPVVERRLSQRTPRLSLRARVPPSAAPPPRARLLRRQQRPQLDARHRCHADRHALPPRDQGARSQSGVNPAPQGYSAFAIRRARSRSSRCSAVMPSL